MRRVFLTVAGAAMIAATPAMAQDRQRSISPYIELSQVLTDDVHGGDVLTYTSVAVGIDASIETRNTQAQVSYRYEHQFSYAKDVGDEDIHSGLARVAARVAPSLTIEAGAIATRARSDIRGEAPGLLAGHLDNTSQLYSAYAGPTLATHVGSAGVNASYRIGYTKADAPGFTGVAPGSPALDTFDHATTQLAQASVGVKSGVVLPIGMTASAAWERDDASQLSQRYDGKYLRGDIIAPVLPNIALIAGVGYEKISVSQKDALKDGAGQPVLDGNGRFVSDPASPRRIAYETDGLIYDAGVIWRPSPRTTLQARVGRRYGGTTYTGSLSYAASRSVGLQIGVYDSVQTFGSQLQDSLASLPTSFVDQRDAFSQQFSGCVFGTSSNATGSCMNGVLQSIAASSYRARGVDAVLVASRGATSFGFGLGYANRHFYAPDTGGAFTINGVNDESYYGQFFFARTLDGNSGINADLFANYYNSGIVGAPGIFSTGLTGTYYRNFGHLSTSASLGLYDFSIDGGRDDLQAQALLGARYSF